MSLNYFLNRRARIEFLASCHCDRFLGALGVLVMMQGAAFVVFVSLVAKGRLGKTASDRLAFSSQPNPNSEGCKVTGVTGVTGVTSSSCPSRSFCLNTYVAEIQFDLRFQASSLLFFEKEICRFSNSFFSISIHQSPTAKQIDGKQSTNSAVSYHPYVPNPRQSKDQSTSRHHVSYCCS